MTASVPRQRFFCMAAIALGALGVSGSELASDGSAKPSPVYSVTEVTVRVMESHPEQLAIEARGATRSGGWRNPQLVPDHSAKYEPGVLYFKFVAEPPRGPALQALTPITARVTAVKPAGFREVRVVASTNSKSSR
jgi:hypothetical protein